jgi:mannose-6-phosphate isomerase-like protein (cupin superfamily)
MDTLIREAGSVGGGSVGGGSVGGGSGGTVGVSPAQGRPVLISPARLGQIVRAIAERPGQWRPVIQFTAERRWYFRMDVGDQAAHYEVWLLSWLPGQQTGFHDHGDAAGAFAVADGDLLESTATVGSTAIRARELRAGAVRSFGAAHLHDVRNASAEPAVSVHAYSPPLSAMRRYEMTTSGLALTGTETAAAGW